MLGKHIVFNGLTRKQRATVTYKQLKKSRLYVVVAYYHVRASNIQIVL